MGDTPYGAGAFWGLRADPAVYPSILFPTTTTTTTTV
jgi:hypothetical protein